MTPSATRRWTGRPPRDEELTRAGVRLVAVPDCGHDIILDNPDAFARPTATAPG
ncbi:hypothetical protein [Streptacidiphilus albus]|uniref:hypothetical protein n=1 Tax=Streptacidiphilus albus TaxID=105425 RepID=UPI000AA5A7BA